MVKSIYKEKISVIIPIYNRVPKRGKKPDHRRSSGLFFIATFYQVLGDITKTEEKPEEINIEIYRAIFSNKQVNIKIINLADKVLQDYFRDRAIKEEIADDFKNFLKWKILKSKPQEILNERYNTLSKMKSVF